MFRTSFTGFIRQRYLLHETTCTVTRVPAVHAGLFEYPGNTEMNLTIGPELPQLLLPGHFPVVSGCCTEPASEGSAERCRIGKAEST